MGLAWHHDVWDLPGLGSKPVPPALAGGFFDHWAPREAPPRSFLYDFYLVHRSLWCHSGNLRRCLIPANAVFTPSGLHAHVYWSSRRILVAKLSGTVHSLLKCNMHLRLSAPFYVCVGFTLWSQFLQKATQCRAASSAHVAPRPRRPMPTSPRPRPRCQCFQARL